ncbi:hypothetical protein V7111_00820 [Neobacillus niacini]|uniref:hypothetical protein n=1 Tax=Neobacillus niacini TaxID=86668 RepID=UPI0030001B7F
MKLTRLIGAVGSIGSLLFCGYILLFNPYTHSSVEPDVFISFTIMYLLPVLLAFYASFSLKPKLMIVCSIWALPLSIYCLATPGIFKWLIFGPILILIVGIRMFKNMRTN